MFLEFFYLLKSSGLKVSVNEWMMLEEALDKGLGGDSLMGFYHLCRSILVKTEADFDTFDACFAMYFQNVVPPEELPDKFRKWLDDQERERDLEDKPDDLERRSLSELMEYFRDRLADQDEKHDGGGKWIGTGGTSPLGRGGYNPSGMRIDGHSRHMSALQVAGERKFRDFRDDSVLEIRQFQMAFRKLRQYSAQMDETELEFSVDKTVDSTSKKGGLLQVEYEKPRRNAVKVLLLMDSDGSMWKYSKVCNMLFQALRKSNSFKDVQVYYFHNCVYDYLYNTPECEAGKWTPTKFVLNKLGSDYKVIFVGDASMAPSELLSRGGNIEMLYYNEEAGIDWLEKFKRKFDKNIWLNPIPRQYWDDGYGHYTMTVLRDTFPMFPLSVNGLESGIKKLLVR